MIQPLFHTATSSWKPEECGALCFSDGSPLHVSPHMLSDIGTLSQSVQIIQKYLSPQPGDVALLNDPYSGGTILSNITLVACFEVNKVPLYIAHRRALRPTVPQSQSIEDEGIRIPPTPIFSKGALNQDVLKILASHPKRPDNFENTIREELLKIQEHARLLPKLYRLWNLTPEKSMTQAYYTYCFGKLKETLHDVPHGEVQLAINLEGGEVIKLHLEHQADKLLVDFRGTSASKRFALTDTATFGVVVGAFFAFFGIPVPLNQGSFNFFEVKTPSGSFLNSAYPAPTFLGMTDGAQLIATVVLRALNRLAPKHQMAECSPTQGQLDILFDDQLHFYDLVAGGMGAYTTGAGESNLSPWVFSPLKPSVEEIEKRFPLFIPQISLRMNSGGKGLHSGGHGLAKSYTLLSDARVRWSIEESRFKANGANGGFAGNEAEITLTDSAGKKTKLAAIGETRLKKGETISILSSGGGGFGHMPKEPSV